MSGFQYTYTLPDGTEQVGRFGAKGLTHAVVFFPSGHGPWKVWSAYSNRAGAEAGKRGVKWASGDDAQVIEIKEG